MPYPKLDGYVFTEKIGSGSYSTVYKAHKKNESAVVAVKCVARSIVTCSTTAMDNLVREISLLKKLTHPHIVSMQDFCWDPVYVFIVMEYCNGGDLAMLLQRRKTLPEHQVLYFLQQLASALQYLKNKGIVHMDLKPHNLLLHTPKPEINTHPGLAPPCLLKVADFGFALQLAEDSGRGLRGSPLYMAPELLTRKSGDVAPTADLWSIGVIMYECLFGAAPHAANSLDKVVKKVISGAPVQIPTTISKGARDLLSRLLKPNPSLRIPYEKFFTHPYLDLENAPTLDNWNKAMEELKKALQLELAGDWRAALAGYRRTLPVMLAAARADPDSVVRVARREAAVKYLERAEEIQRYLQGSQNFQFGQNQSQGAWPVKESCLENRQTSEMVPTNEPVPLSAPGPPDIQTTEHAHSSRPSNVTDNLASAAACKSNKDSLTERCDIS